jgi:hypothetical protein
MVEQVGHGESLLPALNRIPLGLALRKPGLFGIHSSCQFIDAPRCA